MKSKNSEISLKYLQVRLIAAGFLFVFLFLGSCNLPARMGPTPIGENLVLTYAAQTIQAYFTPTTWIKSLTQTLQPGLTVSPQPSETGSVMQPTGTIPLFLTQIPSITPTAIPCNRANFVRDITIPDGTNVIPGEKFTKTWRLRNTGSCTWTADYSLVFVGENAMGGPSAIKATTKPIPPWELLELSVDLIAPLKPDEYIGLWKLRDPYGNEFGLGNDADQPFWVKIVVIGPTWTLTPTITLTPEVTPTPVEPNIVFTYDNVHDCAGVPHATFKIVNNHNTSMESIQISITDLNTDTKLSLRESNVPFMGSTGECPPGGDFVKAGGTAYIGASLGSTGNTGHNARAQLRICTLDNLQGACAEKSVDFTIP